MQCTASFVFTVDHQPRAAMLTFLLHKGLFSTSGAGDVQRAGAPGAYSLPFLDGAVAGRAEIPERTHTAATGAKSCVSLNKCTAMDTWLFI